MPCNCLYTITNSHCLSICTKNTHHLRQGAHHFFFFFGLAAGVGVGCDVLETGTVTAGAFTTLTALGLD